MKRLSILLVLVVFSVSAIAAQKTDTSAPKKPKAPAVDCSTADDATINTNVRAKLSKTPSLKDFTLNAATSAGVVTLTGSVKAGRQKGTATRVAKSVDCVKKVDNQITVEPPAKSGN